MKNRLVLAMVSVPFSLAFMGCASVPKDAPAEMHAAQAELDRASKLNSQIPFPKSVAAAEQDLDKSLGEYKIFKADNSSEAMTQALALAKRSESRAKKANDLTSSIKDWDSNIDAVEGNSPIAELNTKIKNLQAETEQIRKEKAVVEQEKNNIKGLLDAAKLEGPLAKMSDFRIEAPVAFFGTDSAEIRETDRTAISELAKAVKSETSLRLTVAGYADSRGSEEYNAQLSEIRAKNVAELLEKEGIEASRIQIAKMGEKYASGDETISNRQLERKVVVTVGVK